jgi:hypothetical protein
MPLARIAAMFAWLIVATSASAVTTFQYDAQPHEFATGGTSGTITPASATFATYAAPQSLLVTMTDSSGLPTFVDLFAPNGRSFTVGSYQLGSIDAGLIELSLGFGGSGCVAPTGVITIQELATDSATQAIVTFAADFVVHCHSEDAKLVAGPRINSSIPYNGQALTYDGPAFSSGAANPAAW